MIDDDMVDTEFKADADPVEESPPEHDDAVRLGKMIVGSPPPDDGDSIFDSPEAFVAAPQHNRPIPEPNFQTGTLRDGSIITVLEPENPLVPKQVRNASEAVSDVAAKERRRDERLPAKIQRQEESQERQWRRLLDGLPTTELVHLRVQRRDLNGEYLSLGARYNTSVDEIRKIENLLPYGTGSSTIPAHYIVSVAPASAREDDNKAYRKFPYVRIGDAPPDGWSLNSVHNYLDQEVDMATARDIGLAIMREAGVQPGSTTAQQSNQHQQVLTPAGMGMFPGMPYNPATGGFMGTPYNPYGFYPPPPPPEDRRSEDARRREEREFVERQAEARRSFEETIRVQREQMETRHKQEMDKLADIVRVSEERAQRAEAEAKIREAQAAAERRDAEHRAEVVSLTGKLDMLVAKIQTLENGGGPQNQMMMVLSSLKDAVASSKPDNMGMLATLFPGIITTVQGYLQSEREERRSEAERRQRELAFERERMVSEADRSARLWDAMSQQQMRSAEMTTNLMRTMQDPSGMVAMARLNTETLGSTAQMMAQLARSGLGGGGGSGESKVDYGEIVGRIAQAAGQILGGYTRMRASEMEQARRVALQGMAPIPSVAIPPQVAQASDPQPEAEAKSESSPKPETPGEPEARSQSPLASMNMQIQEAVRRKVDPKKVAGLIDAFMYTAIRLNDISPDPMVQRALKSLTEDTFDTLKAAFPEADEAYLKAIIDALEAVNSGSDEEEPEPESTTPTNGNISPPGGELVIDQDSAS